jgi:hypothetical protein
MHFGVNSSAGLPARRFLSFFCNVSIPALQDRIYNLSMAPEPEQQSPQQPLKDNSNSSTVKNEMPAEPPPVNTTVIHFLIAGAGAAFPLICQVALVDTTKWTAPTLVNVVGFIARVIGAFFCGGALAHYMYWSERNPFKLFLAAMSAPAMATALINGQGVKGNQPLSPPAQSPTISSSTAAKKAALIPFSGIVYAADQYKTLSLPDEGIWRQFVRGVTGDAPKDVYFAMAGSYPTEKWAQAVLKRVKMEKEFASAEIYAPSSGNHYYSVVIKPALTMDTVQVLVKSAIDTDLLDAYAWRFGDPGVLPSPPSWADQLGHTDYIDRFLGTGYAKSLSEAAMDALVGQGRNSVSMIGNILKDTSARRGRDERLLLDRLVQAVNQLESQGVSMPVDINIQMGEHFTDCSIATPFFEKALKQDSGSLATAPKDFCQLATCYFFANKLENAIENYRRCGDKADATANRLFGRALVERGRKARRENRIDDSQAAYREGLEKILKAREQGDDPKHSQPEFDEATKALQTVRK